MHLFSFYHIPCIRAVSVLYSRSYACTLNHCSVSVSYTHLDVYKRQVIYKLIKKASLNHRIGQNRWKSKHQRVLVGAYGALNRLSLGHWYKGIKACYIPVSYTHLQDLVVSGKSLSPKLSWPPQLFFMVIIKILFFRKEEMLIYVSSPLTFSMQLFKALFMITLRSNAFNFVFCG